MLRPMGSTAEGGCQDRDASLLHSCRLLNNMYVHKFYDSQNCTRSFKGLQSSGVCDNAGQSRWKRESTSAVQGLGYHGKRFGNDRKYLPLAGRNRCIIRIRGALLNDTLKHPAPATQCNPIRRRHTALS